MKRAIAVTLIVFVLFAVGFSTWQMFKGNLEAAFSMLPFLLIVYLFLKFKG